MTYVLYVDDDVDWLEYLGKSLKRAGYTTDCACTIDTGMAMASEKAYNIIVLDGLGGRWCEASKRIREIEGNRTDVVICVFSTSSAVVEKAGLEGLVAVQKPDVEGLIESIGKAQASNCRSDF